MTNPDTVERIRRANPVSVGGTLHDDATESAALFSSIERRRAEMLDTKLNKPRRPEPARVPWYRRPLLVFGAAAVVAVAVFVPLVLLGGEGADVADEPTVPSVPASTAAPSVGQPDEPVATAPPATAAPEVNEPAPPPATEPPSLPEPEALAFDQLLVGDRMAMDVHFVDGRDGLPAIDFWSETTEAYFDGAAGLSGRRLVQCLDAGCTEYEVTDIDAPVWSNESLLNTAVFRDPGSVARVCLDARCEAPVMVDVGIVVEGAGQAAMAVGDDGLILVAFQTSPIDENGNLIPVDLMVAKCLDDACTTVETHRVATVVDEADLAYGREVDVGFSIYVGEDGLPMIAYGTIDGLHLIHCPDQACTAPE